MSSHNDLTFKTSKWMLADLRHGVPAWSVSAHITNQATLGSWFEPWPRPDISLLDPGTKRTLAVEFKPPGHGKREYVTGLGQCLTYLNNFDYALMVMPLESIDGFEIANYLGKTIRTKPLDTLPVGILGYSVAPDVDMQVIEPLRQRTFQVPDPAPQRFAFWGYWRDLSQYDVLSLLRLTDELGDFNKAWRRWWDKELALGKARSWTGTLRKPWSQKSFISNRLNADLSLRHAGLVSSAGQLTLEGLQLLQLGKIYGPDSSAFLDALARCVLIDGHHLELISWIYDVQRSMKPKTTSSSHYKALDNELIKAGVINKPTGTSKPTYLRDEPKLWNALGLLQRRTKSAYFWPKSGLIFNWRRITSVLAAE